MGYATATEKITFERAQQLRTERAEGAFGRALSFEAELLDEAIAVWTRDEAGRWEDPRSDVARMHAPVAPGALGGLIDEGHSVGEAHIIPVATAGSVKTVTRKVKVTVPGALADRLRNRDDWAAKSALRDVLHVQIPGNVLGDITVVTTPAARKPVAKATDGKAVTRYRIRPTAHVSSRDGAVHAALNASYPSQAEARTAALELLTTHTTLPDLTVEAFVAREGEDGALSPALVMISRPTPDEATVTVDVTTHTVKPNPTIDHYDVTFWYHH